MSVFTGLSRLRNSFRRKHSRLSESSGKNGPVAKESPKTARARSSKTGRNATSTLETGPHLVSPPKTGHAASLSLEAGPVVVSGQSVGRRGASSSKRDHAAALSSRTKHGRATSSDTGSARVCSANRERSGERWSENDLRGQGDFDDQVRHPADHTQVGDTAAGSCDSVSGCGQLESADITDIAHSNAHNTNIAHNAAHSTSPSLQSSCSSLTAVNRRSKSNSIQDMLISNSTLDTDGKTTSIADVDHSLHTKGSGTLCVDMSVEDITTCQTSFTIPESAGGRNRSARDSLMTEYDDVCDQDSTCSSNNPVVESDDSYDNLQFADAYDGINDPSAHNLPFTDADSAVTDTTPGNDSSHGQSPGTSHLDHQTPTLRRKPGNLNSNRVSFGTNLQEVLGKAEEGSRVCLDLKDKHSSSSTTACEIPPSLKESASMLALHKDPEEDLTCRVCNKLFGKPRILPCLHTFCWACITNLQTYPISVMEERSTGTKDAGGEEGRNDLSPSPIHGSGSSSSFSQKSESSRRSSEFYSGSEDPRDRGESDRVVLCPTCLRETRVSGTLEELPRNYMAERRVAHYQVTQGGVVRKECDSCGEQGNTCVVTAWCVDCTEHLCSLCELSHRRQKKTKRHQLIDVTSQSHRARRLKSSSTNKTSGSTASANQKSGKNHVSLSVAPPRQILCSQHTDEELKLYCLSCDLPVCRDCVVLDHRDHDCQFLSKELFRDQMGEVQQLIKAVVPNITAVDQQLKKVADVQQQIQSRADEVSHEIQTYMDNFVSAIQQHRQQLLQQVVVVVEEKQHALHVTERHLRNVRTDVEHTCRFVSDMIENASDVEILSVKRLVRERLGGLQGVSATQHQPVSSFMRFAPADTGDVINNFQMFGRVLSRRPSAAASILFSEGLSTARVGHESSVVLRVNSEDGAPYNGRDIHIKAWLIFQSQSIRSLPVGLSLQKNGTYSLKFTPVQPGSHFLHVAIDGQPVKDGPFKFKVKAQWREHRGVWHCCSVCSTGGRSDVPCACRGVMPGGERQGCYHGDGGHPGGHHWSCCAKMVQTSECSGLPLPSTSPVRQVTL